MTKQSGRIEWIDIAKGISIILVVCGHTRLSSVPYIGDWLGAFRMPFFFFISGLLFNPAKNTDFGLFLKKKWKGLGRPFVIFSLVVLLGYACVGQERLYGILYDFPHYGWLGHALWFIPVLFVTNALYFLVCRYMKSDISRATALLVLAVAGYLSYRFDIPNYWNLNFSLTAVLFYGFGNLSAPFLNRLFSRSSAIIMCFALVATAVSFCFVFNTKPEFYVNCLGSGGLTHLVGIAGALMMCSFAVFLSRIQHPVAGVAKSAFKYFGKNSYVVLAFHQIIIILFAAWLPQMPNVACHVVMWIILVLIIELLTRKFPYVLGREKTKIRKLDKCNNMI